MQKALMYAVRRR